MEELDRRIIAMKMEMKEHIPMSLIEGYYVDGELVTFTKMNLFDDQVSIYLPDTFVDMPLHVMQLKYPSQMRPQIIKTNLLANVNFTFSLLENKGNLTPLDIIKGFREVLAHTNPAISASSSKTIKTNKNIELAYFDFVSFGLDEHIYNFSCVAPVGGYILQANFNCLEREKQCWKILSEDVFFNLETHI